MSTESFNEIKAICQQSNNRSQYFCYGSLGYKYSVAHWLKSSCKVARAAVEPGSHEDLVKIMEVVAGDPDLNFAVKGGGHSTNPGFSSVKDGLQISMLRFNQLTYNPQTETLTMGSGCLWDEVYRYLGPKNRTVVGGAGAGGVGVGGWLLGGGYSLRTNQYGLGVDNIMEIGVVTPTGKYLIAKQDDAETKELFWALRGGGNKLGIVTHFVIRTFKENGGGILVYTDPVKVELVLKAITNFTAKWNKHDPKDLKAAVVGAFRHARVQGEARATPKAPAPDPFQEFLDIEPDRGSLGSTTYIALDTQFSLLQIAIPPTTDHIYSILKAKDPPMDGIGELDYRGRWGCVMVSDFTLDFIKEIQKEAKESRLADLLKDYSGLRVVLDIWPFDTNIFEHKTAGPSAWPPANTQAVFPMIVICYWEDSKWDDVWLENMSMTINSLSMYAKAHNASYEGAPVYSNTTLETTKPAEIFQGNLTSLAEIIRKIDPNGVMRKAGGFDITSPSNFSRIIQEIEKLGIGAKEAEKLTELLQLLVPIIRAK